VQDVPGTRDRAAPRAGRVEERELMSDAAAATADAQGCACDPLQGFSRLGFARANPRVRHRYRGLARRGSALKRIRDCAG
jgi:hypothetical protein